MSEYWLLDSTANRDPISVDNSTSNRISSARQVKDLLILGHQLRPVVLGAESWREQDVGLESSSCLDVMMIEIVIINCAMRKVWSKELLSWLFRRIYEEDRTMVCQSGRSMGMPGRNLKAACRRDSLF